MVKRYHIKTIVLLIICFFAMNKELLAEWKYKASMVEFAYSQFKYDYKEDLKLPLKSEEKGTLPGGYFAYTYRWPEETYFSLSTELNQGDTHYDGAYQTGETCKDKTSNKIIRVESELGYTIWPLSKVTISPFIGLGQESWKRDLGQNNPKSGYKEYYLWQYIPTGIHFVYEPKPYVSFGIKGTFRQMFRGKMKVRGDNFDSRDDAKLDKKYEYSVEGPFSLRFSQKYCVNVTPFYFKREFGKSGTFMLTDGQSLVPARESSSTSTSKGIRRGLAYIW
jgi:hypothetical protein